MVLAGLPQQGQTSLRCSCEMKMKEEVGLSSRCMPFEQEHLSDVCPCCGKPAKTMVYWGVAY